MYRRLAASNAWRSTSVSQYPNRSRRCFKSESKVRVPTRPWYSFPRTLTTKSDGLPEIIGILGGWGLLDHR
jgi:hypothetical protein